MNKPLRPKTDTDELSGFGSICLNDLVEGAKAFAKAGFCMADFKKPVKIQGPDFNCCEFI